jgi:PAS domain S-box-containing protein
VGTCPGRLAGVCFVTTEGIFSIAYTAFLVPILNAGFVLGLRAAALVALASATVGFLIGPMQLNPALPQLFAESSADSRWFGHLILFAVGVGMVAFVIGRVRNIVRALEQSEAIRERRNIELREEVHQRKEIETQLRLSEEHHRRVSGMLTDLTFKYVTYDDAPPTQEWIFGPCEEITGFKPEELNLERWTSVVIPGDEESFEDRHRDTTEHGVNESEFRIRRKDGSVRWVRQQLQVVPREGGNEIFGAMRDITERKLAEIALKRERDFISAVLDSAAVMVVVLDHEARLVRVNEAAAAFSGGTVREMEGTVSLHTWSIQR